MNKAREQSWAVCKREFSEEAPPNVPYPGPQCPAPPSLPDEVPCMKGPSTGIQGLKEKEQVCPSLSICCRTSGKETVLVKQDPLSQPPTTPTHTHPKDQPCSHTSGSYKLSGLSISTQSHRTDQHRGSGQRSST